MRQSVDLPRRPEKGAPLHSHTKEDKMRAFAERIS